MENTKQHYCYNHPSIPCYSNIKISSWYGSKYDGDTIDVYVCDDCLDKYINLLKITKQN